mmetsp:Transcript_77941/g.226130  ORF Transcript_77941/g.226130 Transcript_77941/m.226130 type:complete len:230 (-) Transcript_77941:769-1458(-)
MGVEGALYRVLHGHVHGAVLAAAVRHLADADAVLSAHGTLARQSLGDQLFLEVHNPLALSVLMRDKAMEVAVSNVRADNALQPEVSAEPFGVGHAVRQVPKRHTDICGEHFIAALDATNPSCGQAATPPRFPFVVELRAVAGKEDLLPVAAMRSRDVGHHVEVPPHLLHVGTPHLQKERRHTWQSRVEHGVRGLDSVGVQQLATQHRSWIRPHRSHDRVHSGFHIAERN